MDTAKANVVVIVDTSTSMKEDGMDPQRTSLLVAKLFADIVPGELAVVRLLDLVKDGSLFPFKTVGEKVPCSEDPSQMCESIGSISHEVWEKVSLDVQNSQAGALIRPSRGDSKYKKELETHLEQNIGNSLFDLAFRSAQGVLETKNSSEVKSPKTIIWLSDGKTNDPHALLQVIATLKQTGITIESIIFGNGNPEIAEKAGLIVRKASSPAELMKAFAGAFRSTIKAPYEIDHLVSQKSVFEMKPNVAEAWVVIYGDNSLGEVLLQSPDSTHKANYAADDCGNPSICKAGAYRVAYFRNPQPGQWQVKPSDGGKEVAYAVVQRSNMRPVLLGPQTALSGATTKLTAGIQAGLEGELIKPENLPADIELTAKFQGEIVLLNDNGKQGDEVAGDGIYTAQVKFEGNQDQIPVDVNLKTIFTDRTTQATVKLSGSFDYQNGAVHLDLGTFSAGKESCQPLQIIAEHHGKIPLRLQAHKKLPSSYELQTRSSNGQRLSSSDTQNTIEIIPEAKLKLCLMVERTAKSSSIENYEHWLSLHVAGSHAPNHQIPLYLRWQVQALTFWELWGWLILSVLAVLILIFIVLGFILPHRFQATLALSFLPDLDDLDEQTPQPVKQWKGTGIGFYRHARAYLHADYRLSGKSQGALACLQAEKNYAKVQPMGTPLFRETIDGDWKSATTDGQKARPGAVYRIGDKGPYFRVTVNRGGR